MTLPAPALLTFVHEGKEAYPELAAYKAFFEGRFASREVHPRELVGLGDLDRSICWFMMGFYPARPKAAFVIHDYRSLSVGKLSALKDRIKAALNAKPDLRLFQNAALREAMGFADGVPSLLLPMGVPPDVLSFRQEREADHDFCYIGAMSAERKTHKMIDSFLRRYGSGKSFRLYGRPAPFLVERYKGQANIVFPGLLPQRELFAAIQGARAAVNYFPTHKPHALQTPTKLLEYAALGLRIISNEQPQSRLAAETYGIASLWGPAEDLFRDAPETLDWPANRELDPSAFLWPGVIARSGVASFLDRGGAA